MRSNIYTMFHIMEHTKREEAAMNHARSVTREARAQVAPAGGWR